MTIQIPVWLFIILYMGFMSGWYMSYVLFKRRGKIKWYISVMDMFISLVVFPFLILTIFIPQKIMLKSLGIKEETIEEELK